MSGPKRGRRSKNHPNINAIYPTISDDYVVLEDLEFEVGYQAPLDDDPDYEPTPKKKGPVRKAEHKEPVRKVQCEEPVMTVDPKLLVSKAVEPEPPPSNGVVTCPPKARTTRGCHEEHPFLELQQGGFDMLQRELSGFQEGMTNLNIRLNQIEVMLRPIGQIADSLMRIASAVERLTCPPSNDF